MSKNDDNTGLYYRGIIIDKKKSNLDIRKLPLRFITVKPSSDSFTAYKGKISCKVSPTSNIKKIKYDGNAETKEITCYHYPVYIIDFKHNQDDFIFCCLPETTLFPLVFSSKVYLFYRFDLIKICSSFFRLKNSPLLKLTRLNSKLNYDKDDSVTSISFYGKNNLQSNVIRKFLKLYPIEEAENVQVNPFEQKPPLIDPKSCKITYNNNKDIFSLNIDSTGNFSFYLSKNDQFFFLFEILKFAFISDAFVVADSSPLKRTSLSLEKIEN